jgi:hypothetical protein
MILSFLTYIHATFCVFFPLFFQVFMMSYPRDEMESHTFFCIVPSIISQNCRFSTVIMSTISWWLFQFPGIIDMPTVYSTHPAKMIGIFNMARSQAHSKISDLLFSALC